VKMEKTDLTKCEYCGKVFGEEEFRLISVYFDIYGNRHERAFHSVNGTNWADNCYNRSDGAWGIDSDVKMDVNSNGMNLVFTITVIRDVKNSEGMK
jgi:hypothetical protein